MMWLCPWFLYNIGLCSSSSSNNNNGGCCADQSFSPNGICLLPADSGPCSDQYSLRWYYHPLTGLCRQFMYGGCAGNTNNFPTKSQCVEACNAFPADPDFCKMPMESGPCTAHYQKWYYDESTGRCQQFIFGGCDGNDNRFDSEEECLAGCAHKDAADTAADVAIPKSAILPCRSPAVTESPTTSCTNIVSESPERCLQPMHRGPCDGTLPRWFFNRASRECLPFAYGGCHGNRNRFLTREICLTQCRSKMSSPGDVRVNYKQSSTMATAARPIANGMRNVAERGYRSPTDAPMNGPQESNGDNGDNGAGAAAESLEVVVSGTSVVVCLLQKDIGPCSEYTPLWYFDAAADICRRFMYGGCQGNANRFASLEECQKTCLEQEPRHDWVEHQHHPTIAWKKGPHFRAGILPLQDDQPHLWVPPLLTLRMDLPQRTMPPVRMEPPFKTASPPVRVEPAPGRMEPSLRRAKTTTTEQWQQQQQHQGGPKRRKTQSMLPVFEKADLLKDHDGAWQHDESIRTEDIAPVEQKSTTAEKDRKTSSSNIDAGPLSDDRCSLPEDRGRLCSKWRIYWLHDGHVSTCRRFYYGGCDGNENRFKTKEECETACPEPI